VGAWFGSQSTWEPWIQFPALTKKKKKKEGKGCPRRSNGRCQMATVPAKAEDLKMVSERREDGEE
jgi:hypothetical protein